MNKNKIRQLEKEGLNIVGFINEIGDQIPGLDERPVFSVHDIPPRVLIIYFMEQFEPGDIHSLLTEKGLEEGVNFITMS